MSIIQRTLIAAALAGVSLASQAQTNLLTNGSFDGTTTGYIYNGRPTSFTAGVNVPVLAGTVAGWTGSFVSITKNNAPWGNPSALAGFDASYGNWIAGLQANGELTQSLNLAAGEYQLSWFDTNRANSGANQSYQVKLGNVVLDSESTIRGQGWDQETVRFYTTGGATTLSFVGLTNWPTDATSFIDKVVLTAVPEPTSTALMMVGTLALLARRRRIGH
jgi:hypothetical protein